MKIAILGCGVVGSGTAEILMNEENVLSDKASCKVELKYILDIRDLSGTAFAEKAVKDVDIILNDPEVGVVVETMGGVEPAFTFCNRALNAGKCVVTSNKQLVAEKGEELLASAKRNNRAFRFEASVGGVVPVIRTMVNGFSSDEIQSFYGILNGTTNFILTKMLKDNMNFAEALKIAQDMGYAEKDPTADIEGIDACRKTAILSSLAFGTHIKPEEVYTEGITKITLEDASYAENANAEIKLLGRAEKTDNDGVFAVVTPMFVSKEFIISQVEGVYNALNIKGKYSSDVMLYGHGAGKEATASAVVSDVIDCVKNNGFDKNYGWSNHVAGKVKNHGDIQTKLYIRVICDDNNRIKQQIAEEFGEVRYLTRKNAPENEMAFITDKKSENELFERIKQIKGIQVLSAVRVMD